MVAAAAAEQHQEAVCASEHVGHQRIHGQAQALASARLCWEMYPTQANIVTLHDIIVSK